MLTAEQKKRAKKAMKEYLDAQNPDGTTPVEVCEERDQQRAAVIKDTLKPLLNKYLTKKVALDDFKYELDTTNRRYPLWGFQAIKGQMFFNMVVNVADEQDDTDACNAELQKALKAPTSEKTAKNKIINFMEYVKDLGDKHVDAGGSGYGRPRVSSVPYFLSYFWQIQKPKTWPVFYTTSVKALDNLDLWSPSGELEDDYFLFKSIHEELSTLFTKASKKEFGLYDVEHVFWFREGNPLGGDRPINMAEAETEADTPDEQLQELPESYAPPVVSILPRLARRDDQLSQLAINSGHSIERAFEIYTNKAFTIMGYDTKLYGQGQGRVIDGRAIDYQNSYAILWDAKSREGAYRMGTDDRALKEYVIEESRMLKEKYALKNIYLAIISNRYEHDHKDDIARLKMETFASDVCLMEAHALVAMVEARLQNPFEISLGPAGMQRLFAESGILTATTVQDYFTRS